MPRPRKDYQLLNVKLDSTIMERLKKYCDIMGQTKTTALERILQKHLDGFEQELNANRTQLASDVSIAHAQNSFTENYMRDNK